MDWMSVIKSVAPTVATALLGPLGGVAVSALGNALGVSEATQDKIADVIKDSALTPEQISNLKQLELKYQADEKERGFRYAELIFKDVSDARAMQVQTHSMVPPILAGLVTTGFFAILAFMVASPDYKPTEPLLVMLGSLGTAWTMIIGFYFGSSHGSRLKDEKLNGTS
jgi:hypothetical protein